MTILWVVAGSRIIICDPNIYPIHNNIGKHGWVEGGLIIHSSVWDSSMYMTQVGLDVFAPYDPFALESFFFCNMLWGLIRLCDGNGWPLFFIYSLTELTHDTHTSNEPHEELGNSWRWWNLMVNWIKIFNGAVMVYRPLLWFDSSLVLHRWFSMMWKGLPCFSSCMLRFSQLECFPKFQEIS